MIARWPSRCPRASRRRAASGRTRSASSGAASTSAPGSRAAWRPARRSRSASRSGEPEIGVTACFGGLNAALAVPRGALRERVGWGAGAALGCCAIGRRRHRGPGEHGRVRRRGRSRWSGWPRSCARSARTGGLTGFVIGAIYVITQRHPGGVARPRRARALVRARVAGRRRPHGRGLRARRPSAGGGPGRRSRPSSRAARGSSRDAIAGDARLREHALRLASIVAATLLLARVLGLEHGYWIPLTILAVLQPEEHASGVRAVQRATGTLVGTALIALITVLTGEEWLMVAAQAFAAFGLFAVFSRGYFWLVVLLTPTALLTISAVDYQGDADASSAPPGAGSGS